MDALTDKEYSGLSEKQKQTYDFAVRHIKDDWAMGPYGGWVRAHEALESLGWAKVERTVGHRTFVSLVKPEQVKEPG